MAGRPCMGLFEGGSIDLKQSKYNKMMMDLLFSGHAGCCDSLKPSALTMALRATTMVRLTSLRLAHIRTTAAAVASPRSALPKTAPAALPWGPRDEPRRECHGGRGRNARGGSLGPSAAFRSARARAAVSNRVASACVFAFSGLRLDRRCRRRAPCWPGAPATSCSCAVREPAVAFSAAPPTSSLSVHFRGARGSGVHARIFRGQEQRSERCAFCLFGNRPVLAAPFSEEDRRQFSTAVATKDPATLPADLKGMPAGAGLLAVGFIMNQELYVVNDETMLAAGWLGLMAVAVNGLSSGLAEMLDDRAAVIEAELLAQRQEEVDAVELMVSKAQDSIAVNDELIKVCAPENFDEWTKFKMEKTLQKAANDSASQTLAKLRNIQMIEETAARRKLTSIIDDVNAGVAAAIAADKDFASSTIDEAIGMIATAKAS